jgi:ornithine cyclodeaminase/alanine dehydrogenase-like protein (mu-crystallin family)
MPDLPPLRYLSARDVVAAMPPIEERLQLAERTLTALATPGGADMPAKVGVHARPEQSFAHAMPAHLRGASGDDDLLGMKWIAGFPHNRAAGLPALHGILLLNDAGTGIPIAVLDAGPITAQRTAAVSGVAIRRFMPALGASPPRVAIVGAGVQARSHLEVVAHLLPGAEVAIFDRHPERAALAAAEAGFLRAHAASSAPEAVAGADLVITAASFTAPDRRQVMTTDWLAAEALVIAVDYATYCSAGVARDAALFLVDETRQFLANRDAGQFDGYPEPTAMLGDAIRSELPRPAGRVVVSHLGVGLADVVFGDAILRRAETQGGGTILGR